MTATEADQTVAPEILLPDWPDQPAGVGVAVTTRRGGHSTAPWASLNMGQHVGDDPERVTANRDQVRRMLELPRDPVWLQQVHGTEVACIRQPEQRPAAAADAAYTDCIGVPLCVLTADCLPVVLTNADGTEIGVAHAGWRGLCDGVLENLVQTFTAAPEQLLAWLGPAIGPQRFEVGPEVRAAFMAQDADAAQAFRAGTGDRWLADIYHLARQRLQRVGVNRIAGGDFCTLSDTDRFFSYRRDPSTGRMATLIWRHP
ncbi:peptidoglycan editing factor PgeF [Natronospirillum operosum]|uniref:Purine nucleoside phosphorylase n=1 Tax=Natronospirillum operosum TaxID=2759953 RepID=A0A4Z0W9J8_9GAMM|nr:peptidoglycan editing factor PgeF [Natronospirillum operosum]TGG92003.1 peptidoglycan editing factor PgeF [Natronospirillum operosum]